MTNRQGVSDSAGADAQTRLTRYEAALRAIARIEGDSFCPGCIAVEALDDRASNPARGNRSDDPEDGSTRKGERPGASGDTDQSSEPAFSGSSGSSAVLDESSKDAPTNLVATHEHPWAEDHEGRCVLCGIRWDATRLEHHMRGMAALIDRYRDALIELSDPRIDEAHSMAAIARTALADDKSDGAGFEGSRGGVTPSYGADDTGESGVPASPKPADNPHRVCLKCGYGGPGRVLGQLAGYHEKPGTDEACHYLAIIPPKSVDDAGATPIRECTQS